MTTLLVVGRAGTGKSSLCNSILGSRKFSPRATTEEGRLTNERASNDEYLVVDCSGIGDTGGDMPGDVKAVIKSALDGISLCTEVPVTETDSDQVKPFKVNNKSQEGNDTKNDDLPTKSEVEHVFQSQQVLTDGTGSCTDSIEYRKCGFDTLIFVIKFGIRFTKQEKDSVAMVKTIFGDNIFKDWGILVFSYGDNFYHDGGDITFEDWCKQQTGDMKMLFEEVDFRCVIFDNKSRFIEKMNLQNELLKQQVTKIVNKRKRQYTQADFVYAHIGQGKLLSNEEFEEMHRDVIRLMEESNDLLNKMEENQVELQAKIEKLRKLNSELQSQEQKLASKDQGTGLLKDFMTRVTLQKQKLEAVMVLTDVSTARSLGLLVDTMETGVLSVQQEATTEQVESQRHGDSESLKSGLSLWKRCICCYNTEKYERFDEKNTTIN